MDGTNTVTSKEIVIVTDMNMIIKQSTNSDFVNVLQNSFIIDNNTLAFPKNNPTVFYSVNEEIKENKRIFRYYDITSIYKKMYEQIKNLKLENAALIAKANTDDLTGLNNKSSLEVYKIELINSVQDYIYVMCDIDKFKTINDTYGHENGDNVLKAIGGVFKKYESDNCFVARYGGDEFTLIFKNKSKEEVIETLYSLAKDANNIVVSDKDSVTLSIGVGLSNKNSDIGAVIKEADSCLYAAKKNGRNGIGFFKNGKYYFDSFSSNIKKKIKLNYKNNYSIPKKTRLSNTPYSQTPINYIIDQSMVPYLLNTDQNIRKSI